jgi:hypothetical protein
MRQEDIEAIKPTTERKMAKYGYRISPLPLPIIDSRWALSVGWVECFRNREQWRKFAGWVQPFESIRSAICRKNLSP